MQGEEAIRGWRKKGQKRTNVLHLNEIFSFLAAGATLDPAIISKADNLQTNLSSRAEED